MIKKKYILLTTILVLVIMNLDIVSLSVIESTELFFYKIFVSTFPFIILSDVLIYYNYHIFLSKMFGNFISKIFNVNKNSSIIYILSILTSQPNNSIYIKNMLDKKIISHEESFKILCSTYYTSISFVIGSVGIMTYNSFKIGLILLLSNYLCNILIGIYLRKGKYSINNYNEEKTNDNIINVIKTSIIKAINTSFIILGNIIIFSIVSNILSNYIDNNILSSVISGILEITAGINNISKLTLPLNIKIALTSLIINFSSVSIILQSISILNEYKYNIKKIIIIKLLFSIVSSSLILLCYK